MGGMQLGAALALTFGMGFGGPPADERLYGRVYTTEGVVLEGYLRWDRNEVGASDFLDGAKEIPKEHLREAESLDPQYAEAQRRARSLEAFGVRITWGLDDDDDPVTMPASVRFGHIASLTVLDERRALIRLKSGDEVRLIGMSTDLGRGMRGLVVEDARAGATTVRWRGLERVDFIAPPAGAGAPLSPRLHGTVTTTAGAELGGYIAWDLDEVLMSDVLDGRQGRDDHEIPFSDITTISRVGERSSRVTLRDGTVLVLRGTNDVDRNNRGIEVSDALFGRTTVPWDAFVSVTFHAAPSAEPTGVSLEGIGALRGTVHARDGRTLSGGIRWGNTRTAGWETLDGWADGVRFAIEFGSIRTVSRNGSGGVTVTLLDGRTLDLEASDDVGEDNMGIFVKPDGRPTRLVRWRDLDRVDFDR